MGAGFGVGLGAALQGIGEGLMKQQLQKDQDRRDAALSALRMQEQSAHDTATSQAQAEHDQRYADTELTLERERGMTTLAAGKAAAVAQTARDARQNAHEIDMQTLKGKQAVAQAVAEVNAKATAEGDQIADTKVDYNTGAIIGIKKNGEAMILQGVIARERPPSSKTDDLFGTGGTSGPGGTISSANAKTITHADLMEKAQQAGLDEQAAQAWAKRNGYTVK